VQPEFRLEKQATSVINFEEKSMLIFEKFRRHLLFLARHFSSFRIREILTSIMIEMQMTSTIIPKNKF
jgi:hypothetical protein